MNLHRELLQMDAVDVEPVLGGRDSGYSVIDTNVFKRTPSGWRIVSHRASSAPPMAAEEKKGPLR